MARGNPYRRILINVYRLICVINRSSGCIMAFVHYFLQVLLRNIPRIIASPRNNNLLFSRLDRFGVANQAHRAVMHVVGGKLGEKLSFSRVESYHAEKRNNYETVSAQITSEKQIVALLSLPGNFVLSRRDDSRLC